MDEQLQALLEAINALKNSQEEVKNELKEKMEKRQLEMQKGQQDMRNGPQDMQKSQETKNELKDRMEEESVEEKIALKVEEKIAVVEEKIEKKVEEEIEKIKQQVEEKYEVAGKFSLISQRVEDLEKKLPVSGNKNERKILPSSPVPVSTALVLVPVTASAVGDAAEVLQTLPDTARLNLNSLYDALDLRFDSKYSKDYARLQMETRHQTPEVSLQENPEGCKNGRCPRYLKSALLYALKVEAATQASCIDRHSIRGARVTADAPCESPRRKEVKKLKEEIQDLIAQRQNRRRRSITCWGCGETGHLRSNCPRNDKENRSTKCWRYGGAGHLRKNRP
ncbi:uncharacterized protein TNCV_1537001 [Trichonephila clavipes]|nr:uncharacterized protein TNCV_1537001 [Trichonephila clavipes]